MKTRDGRRPMRRRTSEELAREHEQALLWRATLRAEPAGLAAEISAAPSKARSERSRFAAAIARAEFGRFYFKEMRPGPSRKPPRRNGKS